MHIAADTKIRAVETYVAGYAAGDVDTILSIFAEDAVLEDPVGTPAHQGKAALRGFFSVGSLFQCAQKRVRAEHHAWGHARHAGHFASRFGVTGNTRTLLTRLQWIY